MELLVADGEDVLALEDEEELVLALVDMQRSVERVRLLDDRERPVGRLGARLDEELGASERQPLPRACVELVSLFAGGCDGVTLLLAGTR